MGETSGSFESLSIETKDHVAQVTLLGPGKGNAMGPAFWAELPVAFAALDADPDVRAIVLTGSGNNFSYGLDLPAMGGLLAGQPFEAAATAAFRYIEEQLPRAVILSGTGRMTHLAQNIEAFRNRSA